MLQRIWRGFVLAIFEALKGYEKKGVFKLIGFTVFGP